MIMQKNCNCTFSIIAFIILPIMLMKYTIFFCFNLENQEVNQLTYYLIGAFNPIVLNNVLYHLVYDYEGYHLTYLDLNNIQDEKLNSIVINNVPKNLIEFENNVIASQSEKDLKKNLPQKILFSSLSLLIS